MKTLKYSIIAFVISILSFTSCNIFEEKPIDKITQNNIWDSPSLMNAYLLPLYRNMHPGYYTSIMTGFFKVMSVNYLGWYTDQLTVGYPKGYSSSYGDVLKGNVKGVAGRAYSDSQNYYTQIASVNLLLGSEGKIENPDKKRIIAEAHFFRAWYYYRLWTTMGGVMLIDKEVNPLVNPEKFPRASYDEMVEFIVREANLAAEGLEGTYNSEHLGRIRKGAAIMLKAKTYYWAAAKRFQNVEKSYLGFENDRSNEMLEKCAAAYEELFTLPDHSLIEITSSDKDQIIKQYRAIFLAKHSKESIFEVNHNNEGTGDGGLFFSNIDSYARSCGEDGGYCGYCPTQNHVDQYRMSENAKMIGEAGSGYNAQNPYVGRDVRFYANVLYDGATFRKRKLEIRSVWAAVDGKFVDGKDITPKSKNNGATNTGYYMAKLTNEDFSFENEAYSTQNCIVWRLAEAYLDYAHVKFLLAKPDVALEYINKIRTRVKEKALSAITLEDIMNERKVELAFEETSYWDIMRSGEAQRIMSGSTNPLYGVKITEKDGVVTYVYGVVNGSDDATRYYDKRQLYLPLDWDDIRYHAIEQNPDWVE